ncbi:hypothetical protein ATU3C_17805 [Agrobacterium genomosp. 3 str. RTP8]|uniref:hypothetical protein n=1 Tax=Agrobacterium tomkonis TaxID=1183410 RepID=UPI001CD9D260|nr:hypothetical protein [Agrobacterium tomkonis RTP8]
MGKKDKKPRVARQPEPQKKPKFHSDPSVKGAPIVWRFSHADKGGPFAWTALADPAEFFEVIGKLAEIETVSENDLMRAGSHPIPLHSLCKDAQDRLVELQHDDLDELFSIRLKGTMRVFCIHHANVMRILWYDPEHKVCPSQLKHT